jgi:tetratricopeptide (TPR) repeat protein
MQRVSCLKDMIIRRLTLPFIVLNLLVWFTGCGILGRKWGGATANHEQITSELLAVSEKYIDASKEKILGNFEASRKLLQECIKLDPEHDPSYYQLADIGHITGNYQNALVNIEKAVELDPQNGWYKVLQADLLMKLERYGEAVKVFREINRIWPQKRIWYEGLAKSQLLSGDQKGAIKTWDFILERFGFDETIFFKIVNQYVKDGNQSQVQKRLKLLVKEFPFETRYLGYLASSYKDQGKIDEAFKLWQEILRLEPANGEVRFEMADYYRKKGDDTRAYQELTAAFGTPNLSIDAKIVVLMSYYNLTFQYPGLLPEAYKLLDLTIQNHPDNPKGWSIYADFLSRDKRYAEATALYKKVTSIDSTRYVVWEQLLYCADASNDFITLTTEGEKAVRLFPDQGWLYLYYSNGLMQNNKIPEASKAYSRGILFAGFNDTLTAALNHGLGCAYWYSGDREKGFEYLKKSVAKGIYNAQILTSYARMMAQVGEQREMTGFLAMAQKISSDDPFKPLISLWNSRMENPDFVINTVVESLMKEYNQGFAVMQEAAELCKWCGQKELARQCLRNALAVSKGAYLTESMMP